MCRLFLLIKNEQRKELKNHLIMNRYHVKWETDNIISVDEDEIDYVKTILHDRNIQFSDTILNQNKQPIKTEMTKKDKTKQTLRYYIWSGKAKKILSIIWYISWWVFFILCISDKNIPITNVIKFITCIVWMICHIVKANYGRIGVYLLKKLG